MEQAPDEGLFATLDSESNSIATIVKHLTGNMKSRWTDFLTTDGEKADRNRDAEFEAPAATRAEVMAPVSYTHLDVYKRQVHDDVCGNQLPFGGGSAPFAKKFAQIAIDIGGRGRFFRFAGFRRSLRRDLRYAGRTAARL